MADVAAEMAPLLRRDDRYAVMAFTYRTQMFRELTAIDRGEPTTWPHEILDHKFRGPTFLLRAVDDAAQYLLQQPRAERRRAILVFTDNRGRRSRRLHTVLQHVWEADAVVIGVTFQNAGQITVDSVMIATHPYMIPFIETITGAVENSGGEMLAAKGDYLGVLRLAIEKLRQRYTLYYAMPQGPAGKAHQVTVDLTGAAHERYPKARVLARKGYIAPREPTH